MSSGGENLKWNRKKISLCNTYFFNLLTERKKKNIKQGVTIQFLKFKSPVLSKQKEKRIE